MSSTNELENILADNSDVHKAKYNTNNPNTLGLGYVEASSNICEYACHNGFPQQPDIDKNVYDLDAPQSFVERVYEGCCSCAAEAANRPSDGSFWHFRFTSEKMSTVVSTETRILNSPWFTNELTQTLNGAQNGNWHTWATTSPDTVWWTSFLFRREYSSENKHANDI